MTDKAISPLRRRLIEDMTRWTRSSFTAPIEARTGSSILHSVRANHAPRWDSKRLPLAKRIMCSGVAWKFSRNGRSTRISRYPKSVLLKIFENSPCSPAPLNISE